MTTNTLSLVHTNGTTRLLTVAARLVTAGLTAAMAVVHFHLWNTGYKSIHIIGILFLLNFIGGVILAAALLVTPTRWLSLTALATALFTAGTLLGLILSLNVGLFGFHEYSGVPYEQESLWLESIGIAATLILSGALARTTLAWYRQTFRRPRPIA